MSQAKKGDTVKVHYTGKLTDGSVFDSSQGRDPLEFEIGKGMVIPGFENAISGMNIGDSTTVEIPSDQAYGPYHDGLKQEVSREEFPNEIEPQVGQRYQVKQENGQMVVLSITDLTETMVTLDANHPLAGKDLTFDIELVAIGS